MSDSSRAADADPRLGRTQGAAVIYVVMAVAVASTWSWASLPIAIALAVGFSEIAPIRRARGWPVAISVTIAGALAIVAAGFMTDSPASFAVLVALTSFGAGLCARWGLYAVASVVPLLLVILSAPNSPVAALPRAGALIVGGLLGTMLMGILRISPPTKEITVPKRAAMLIGLALAIVVGVTTFLSVEYEVDRGHWIPISVLMIAVPSLKATEDRSLLRTTATVAGAVVASIVAIVVTHDVVVIALALLTAVLSVVVAKTYYWRILFITVSVVLYAGGGEDSHEAALIRVGATIIGAGIVLATARAILWIDHWLDEESIMPQE
ncbi:MAG: FUSC family protein [Actinomycetes bacterium]